MCGTCGCQQTTSRLVQLERDLFEKNNRYAERNRHWLRARSALALNLMSSPGAGKTTLLVKTLEALKGEIPLAVIEGDPQTRLDAERIQKTGTPVVQLNTGKGCHLDAHRVGHALERLDPPEGAVIFIENVGNLVCPAGFDLGEDERVVLLSVPEGEDKPLKYPEAFYRATLLLITKLDLLPYVDFDLDRCLENVRRVHPGLETIALSARSGEGFDRWLGWLRGKVQEKATPR